MLKLVIFTVVIINPPSINVHAKIIPASSYHKKGSGVNRTGISHTQIKKPLIRAWQKGAHENKVVTSEEILGLLVLPLI